MRYEDYKDMVEALATVFNEDPQIVWQVIQDNPPMTKVEVTHVADAEEGKQMDLDEMIREVMEQDNGQQKLEQIARMAFEEASLDDKLTLLFDAWLKNAAVNDLQTDAINKHAEAGEVVMDSLREVDELLTQLMGTDDAIWSQLECWKDAVRGLAEQVEELRIKLETLKK